MQKVKLSRNKSRGLMVMISRSHVEHTHTKKYSREGSEFDPQRDYIWFCLPKSNCFSAHLDSYFSFLDRSLNGRVHYFDFFF